MDKCLLSVVCNGNLFQPYSSYYIIPYDKPLHFFQPKLGDNLCNRLGYRITNKEKSSKKLSIVFSFFSFASISANKNRSDVALPQLGMNLSLFHDLFLSSLLHNLFMSCSILIYNLSMTCLWFVSDFFTINNSYSNS